MSEGRKRGGSTAPLLIAAAVAAVVGMGGAVLLSGDDSERSSVSPPVVTTQIHEELGSPGSMGGAPVQTEASGLPAANEAAAKEAAEKSQAIAEMKAAGMDPSDASAAAELPGMSDVRDQAPFSAYAGEIAALSDKGHAGFADYRLDVEHHAIVVLWKGDPPTTAEPIVAAAAADGITISFERSPYSDADLQAALGDLAEALPAKYGDTREPDHLSKIGISQGWDGLDVAGVTASTDPRIQAELRKIAAAAIGDIPLFFVPYDPHIHRG
ncbi:hypothetical protein D1871_14120 [Nakamurella silvestris]|nr:hypothetical protein D1871_14120 [Nakamurella silvestris]